MSDALLTPSHVPFDHAYTHWERGRALHSEGKLIEAGNEYCAAVTAYGYDPRSKAYALNNLGIIMGRLGHDEKAAKCFEHAVQLCPENGQILNNYGNTRVAAGDYATAQSYFRQSIKREPDLADARLNAAVLQLLTGDLPRGWREYEWRWKSPSFGTPRLETTNPRLSKAHCGLSDRFDLQRGMLMRFDGKTVLLWHEQGFGDSIMFIRYARMVKELTGARVLFLGPPELEKLFAHVDGVDEYRTVKPDDAEFDAHCPLLSLPDLFDTRLGNIPWSGPYIKAPKVSERTSTALRVGIAWAGRPEHGKDKWRSTKLAQWQDLMSVDGVQWLSFQIGKPREQLVDAPKVVDMARYITDYVDTAQWLNTVDLLISVDTSVVHLAGALGVETWMLTPFNPDWRWLLGIDRSEWYPSLRLFRQEKLDDWAPVFQRVKQELTERTEKR